MKDPNKSIRKTDDYALWVDGSQAHRQSYVFRYRGKPVNLVAAKAILCAIENANTAGLRPAFELTEQLRMKRAEWYRQHGNATKGRS